MKKTTKAKAEVKETMVNLAVVLGEGGIYKNIQTAKGQISRKLPTAKDTGFMVSEKEAKEFVRKIADNDKSKSQVPATELLKAWDERVPKLEGIYKENFNKKKINMTKVSTAFHAVNAVLYSDTRTPEEKIEKVKEILERVADED